VRSRLARPILFIGLGTLMLAAGCDTEKIARLEKENKELREKQTVAEYELREKCSRDAKAWFNENWGSGRDKDTMLLVYTNHYHNKMNKCFIFVEYHYSTYMKNGSWANDMMLWDVQENSQYGEYSETHTIFRPQVSLEPQDMLLSCTVYGKQCKTKQEFNNLVWPYMND
jgi:hypothetical protein